MFNKLDITTSALVAHRQWMTAISNNLANQFTLEDPDGNYAPYRARQVIFSPGDPSRGSNQGVHVSQILESDAAFRKVYEPGHPYADKSGYVQYPNVNPVKEQMNAMVALNAYQANITAAEATKNMLQTSLQLIA